MIYVHTVILLKHVFCLLAMTNSAREPVNSGTKRLIILFVIMFLMTILPIEFLSQLCCLNPKRITIPQTTQHIVTSLNYFPCDKKFGMAESKNQRNIKMSVSADAPLPFFTISICLFHYHYLRLNHSVEAKCQAISEGIMDHLLPLRWKPSWDH